MTPGVAEPLLQLWGTGDPTWWRWDRSEVPGIMTSGIHLCGVTDSDVRCP